MAGALGLVASFALTLDKLSLLQHPTTPLACDLSPLVSCTPGLTDASGSLLGFPNALVGLVAFPVPIAVAAALLAGAELSRWFWRALEIGMVGALGGVAFLIGQSITVLGVLCPWCLLVWAAVIPMGIGVVLHGLAAGHWPVGALVRRVARVLLGWVPIITLCCYLGVAVLAQLRLHLLQPL